MNVAQLGALIVASAVVIVVAGVDMALFTRQMLMHGRRAALVTLAAGFTGSLTHTALATAGLSVVLATSATAYSVVKIIGAGYLVVVGVQTLWATRHGAESRQLLENGRRQSSRTPLALRRAYLLGLGSGVTPAKRAPIPREHQHTGRGQQRGTETTLAGSPRVAAARRPLLPPHVCDFAHRA